MLDWKRLLSSLIKKLSSWKKEEQGKLQPGGDEVIRNSSGIYRRYSAPNKKAAIEFLEKQEVKSNLTFIVVETPEGTVAKDVYGIFGQ
jgi:hypothetical protein